MTHDFIGEVLEGTLQADDFLGCGLGQHVLLEPGIRARSYGEVLAEGRFDLLSIVVLVGNPLAGTRGELVHLVVTSLPVRGLHTDGLPTGQHATGRAYGARTGGVASPSSLRVERGGHIDSVSDLVGAGLTLRVVGRVALDGSRIHQALPELGFRRRVCGVLEIVHRRLDGMLELVGSGLPAGVVGRITLDEANMHKPLKEVLRRTCWKMDRATSRNCPSRSVGALPVVWSCWKEAARRVSSKSPPTVAC